MPQTAPCADILLSRLPPALYPRSRKVVMFLLKPHKIIDFANFVWYNKHSYILIAVRTAGQRFFIKFTEAGK